MAQAFSNEDQIEGIVDVGYAPSTTAAEPSPLYQWLKANRIEILHKSLVDEYFESVSDFDGMNEKTLSQLCDKMKIDKMGLRRRFINAVLSYNKENASKNEHSFVVITENEEKVLKNIKNVTKNTEILNATLNSAVKDLSEMKRKCEKEIENEFNIIRKEIDKREKILFSQIKNIFDKKNSKLTEMIDESQNVSLSLKQIHDECYNSLKDLSNDARNNIFNKNKTVAANYNDFVNQQMASRLNDFIKITHRNNNIHKISTEINNFCEIIDDFDCELLTLSFDAPIVTEITQTDLTIFNVKWKNTQKTINAIKWCKDNQNKYNKNNDNNSVSYNILPFINDNKNNSLITLNMIDVNNIDNSEYNINLSNDFENEYKIDNNNDNVTFECQMKIINNQTNVQSQWSNVKKIKLNTKPKEYKCIFTNLNGIGRNGPTKLGDYYNGQSHFSDVILDNYGMQIWTAPYNGYYNIIAYGAKGGNSKYKNKELFGGNGHGCL